MAVLPREAVEEAKEYCFDEYKDYVVYRELARMERRGDLREVLSRFAEQEHRHYLFWRRIAGSCEVEVSSRSIFLFKLMRRLLGLTFTLRFLERHESKVVESYRRYLRYLSGSERRELEDIIRDEEEHESSLMGSIDESVVKYLSFIALGLADAIVEITGVHAGFLGATKETIVAGIAGLIVGVSAALSMSGAAYLQAKAEVGGEREDPGKSALVTGLSYITAVAIMALPYFLTRVLALAFAVSVVLGVLIVALFTYYNAVLAEKDFRREVAENLLILFGTAAASYAFGSLIGSVFGLEHIF